MRVVSVEEESDVTHERRGVKHEPIACSRCSGSCVLLTRQRAHQEVFPRMCDGAAFSEAALAQPVRARRAASVRRHHRRGERRGASGWRAHLEGKRSHIGGNWQRRP